MFDWIYSKARTKLDEMLSTNKTCSLSLKNLRANFSIKTPNIQNLEHNS